VAAINGFDSYGHYLRAQLIVNTCTTYTIKNDPSCTANFRAGTARSASAGADDSLRSPRLVRQDRVAHGESVASVLASLGGDDDTPKRSQARKGSSSPIALPPALLPGDGAAQQQQQQAQQQSSGTAEAPRQDPSAALLDYLLGGGG
jgi:hypothetical protein